MSSHGNKILSDIIKYTVLILISFFMILPFVWMLSSSFKLPEDIFGYPPRLIPQNLILSNYTFIFQEKNLLGVLFNTIIIALSATLLSLFFTTSGWVWFCQI